MLVGDTIATMSTMMLVILTLLSWGFGSFLTKLAANRIGEKSVVWDTLGLAITTFLYGFLVYRAKDIVAADRMGVLLALLAGVVGAFGGIFYYMVVTRKEASVAIPATALYPALAAILAFIFLKEAVTPVRVAGILLATVAIYLLSL